MTGAEIAIVVFATLWIVGVISGWLHYSIINLDLE